MTRWRALLAKELTDVRRNIGPLVPVALIAIIALVIPFLIVIIVPRVTGEPLATDSDLIGVSRVVGYRPQLTPEARIQFFLFQQFLLLFLLLPITGAMALAAHAIVSEKQARTLEALLATPITTLELLIAKVLGALLPTLAISAAGVALYLIGIALFAEPGVVSAMLGARTILMLLLLGPAAALVSLQAAVLISSRVNDARTAQQFGVLIIIPLTGLLVAQLTGSMWLSTSMIALIGAALLAIWLMMTAISVSVFEREAILTRWK